MSRVRVDAELVRRGLARSREHAAELVAAGRVRIGRRAVSKPATAVPDGAVVSVAKSGVGNYVSRGGDKLVGALAAFPSLMVAGRRCLDAGASTGGFTEVLLDRGASMVVAVDVGHDQLVPQLRADPRVAVYERMNVRDLTAEQIGGVVELVVADLSFISLTLVLPALRASATEEADFVLLVKPQFEVGRARISKGGVVKDPELHAESIRTVASAAASLGLGVCGLSRSPLPGPAGNVEYFLWLRAGAGPLDLGGLSED
ncbi:TlyA family RNA methyltransferase [Tenggerimyces flavus]|uniref:TlyA family RNA methyltransferase n=1 Tax=Tenggerimyces flavus TaxID=1708749 RepID=A0ABV7YIW5_9ACTN|nr:TlyA family RNA methyltransferase [Tenggerimyces flavus]MBM7787450.1 23S rRNA (cytidine1920-2'-O)/16S rRNA (cytidine1409-2'-O)-methyltransferase [Tenggerimyces flavus]